MIIKFKIYVILIDLNGNKLMLQIIIYIYRKIVSYIIYQVI
jgi:hypothetical protein